MRVALVTTPPEVSGGIGDYTRSLLAPLRELVDLELFVAPRDAGQAFDGMTLRSCNEVRARSFDRILYQLGNVRAHAFMVPLLGALGGTVALHDWILFDLATAARPGLERGGLAGHFAALREGGFAALRIHAASRRSGRALCADRFELPLNRSVVRRADAFVVHSRWMRDRILAERNAPTPIGIVTHGAERLWRDEDRRATRARHGLPASWRDAFLLVSFGAVQEHKRVEPLLRALALARVERPKLRLVLVGELACETLDFRALVRDLGLEDSVHCTGFLPAIEAESHLHAADLCVNLRGPSTGGSSGGLFRALSLGRAVIASDVAEQRELPEACVTRIAPGSDEVSALARCIATLHDDPDLRAVQEAAARRFVDEECHWSHVARRYAELLEALPAHRTNRKSLIQAAVRVADLQRAERAARASSGAGSP